jgi:hypothetical protein
MVAYGQIHSTIDRVVVSPVRRRGTRARLFYENRGSVSRNWWLKELVHLPGGALAHIREDVGVPPEGHRRIGVAPSPICPDSRPRWGKSRDQITRRSAKTLYLWA